MIRDLIIFLLLFPFFKPLLSRLFYSRQNRRRLLRAVLSTDDLFLDLLPDFAQVFTSQQLEVLVFFQVLD